MAPRLWLLVEWIEENNVFASYEVVNVDTFSYKESDLQPGKLIFISLKHNDPRRAKVIRVSDNKRQVKEHKDFLERQDKQVKNVLQLCMRTIKEMKSDQYPNAEQNSLQLNKSSQKSGFSGLPHIITAKCENSDDSDVDSPRRTHHSKVTNYINQTHHQSIRYEPNSSRKKATKSPAVNQRLRSIVSSTPLPGKSVQENITLCFDQGTQTDEAWSSIAKIEEIEIVLKHLYSRFQSLVMNVNNTTNGTIEISECEQIREVSCAEPNDSWVAPNNITESVEVCQNIEDNNVNMNDIGAEQIVETENEDVKIPVKLEAVRKNNDNSRVRRMSAQTTYSNEMIPIGNGHAMVPARLLNEIEWRSYTTATRQLLQAVFPRKVLATHSLTGKPSPAHLGKPAKKILDPNLVEDIIITVSSKIGIPRNLVRNTITVKCTDEAKLYRNRQRHRLSRKEKNHQNDENIAPSLIHSSDESSHNIT